MIRREARRSISSDGRGDLVWTVSCGISFPDLGRVIHAQVQTSDEGVDRDLDIGTTVLRRRHGVRDTAPASHATHPLAVVSMI